MRERNLGKGWTLTIFGNGSTPLRETLITVYGIPQSSDTNGGNWCSIHNRI